MEKEREREREREGGRERAGNAEPNAAKSLAASHMSSCHISLTTSWYENSGAQGLLPLSLSLSLSLSPSLPHSISLHLSLSLSSAFPSLCSSVAEACWIICQLRVLHCSLPPLLYGISNYSQRPRLANASSIEGSFVPAPL